MRTTSGGKDKAKESEGEREERGQNQGLEQERFSRERLRSSCNTTEWETDFQNDYIYEAISSRAACVLVLVVFDRRCRKKAASPLRFLFDPRA